MDGSSILDVLSIIDLGLEESSAGLVSSHGVYLGEGSADDACSANVDILDECALGLFNCD